MKYQNTSNAFNRVVKAISSTLLLFILFYLLSNIDKAQASNLDGSAGGYTLKVFKYVDENGVVHYGQKPDKKVQNNVIQIEQKKKNRIFYKRINKSPLANQIDELIDIKKKKEKAKSVKTKPSEHLKKYCDPLVWPIHMYLEEGSLENRQYLDIIKALLFKMLSKNFEINKQFPDWVTLAPKKHWLGWFIAINLADQKIVSYLRVVNLKTSEILSYQILSADSLISMSEKLVHKIKAYQYSENDKNKKQTESKSMIITEPIVDNEQYWKVKSLFSTVYQKLTATSGCQVLNRDKQFLIKKQRYHVCQNKPSNPGTYGAKFMISFSETYESWSVGVTEVETTVVSERKTFNNEKRFNTELLYQFIVNATQCDKIKNLEK